MKILSDNPALLDEIAQKLKTARIKFDKETKEVEGGMGDPVTVALDLYHLTQQYWQDVALYVIAVKKTGKYLASQIEYVTNDGRTFSYDEYNNMTLEQKQEQQIFKA